MQTNVERRVSAANGWVLLGFNLGLALLSIALLIGVLVAADRQRGDALYALVPIPVLLLVAAIILLRGHFTLQPNESCLLLLFGKYVGTVRDSGFHWTNPFYSRRKISLRARNFDGERLKVNDRSGNPIEISAVIVWRVSDTAKAFFDVDDFQHFVRVQSESALRQLAGQYSYDHGDDDDDAGQVTLRAGGEEVNAALRREVQERLEKAGVDIEEARLNHLAYAQEIASAMLRRQQAEAIIAARKKIVHGAVSMVEMALRDLAAQNVVKLDDERKAAMVSNLLVVLCGETEAQPVVNAGTPPL